MTARRTTDQALGAGPLARGVTLLAVAATLIFFLESFAGVALQIATGKTGAGFWAGCAAALIKAAPGAIYLWGLWSVRRAFARIAGGEVFHPVIAETLDTVGRALAGSAVFSLVFTPSLLGLVGAGPGYLIDFDMATIVLGVTGVLLVVMAKLQRRAAALDAEMREII